MLKDNRWDVGLGMYFWSKLGNFGTNAGAAMQGLVNFLVHRERQFEERVSWLFTVYKTRNPELEKMVQGALQEGW